MPTIERRAKVMTTLTWSPIPMDACHRCFKERGVDPKDPLYGLGLPVAVSGIENNRQWVSVRYICPRCRSVWDCSWSPEGFTIDGCSLDQFEDRYIEGYEEGLVAKPLQGVMFPAGPSSLFTQT